VAAPAPDRCPGAIAAGSALAANDRERTRTLLAAAAFSLACHALVLAGMRGWRVAGPVPGRLLVVTLAASGGAAAGPGAPAAGNAASGRRAAPAAVAQAPAVVGQAPAVAANPARPAPAPRPAPARGAAAAPFRPAAAVPAVAAAARPDGATALPGAAAEPRAASAVAGAASALAAAAGAAGAGGDGAGAVAGGGGSGGGSGGGDGLRAFCTACPAPDYPPRARRQGWQGTVDIALAVGGDGSVTEARVARSSGYPALDEVALDAARRSRFRAPAAGADFRGQLRYRFVLDATAAWR
jgi:protein TonB